MMWLLNFDTCLILIQSLDEIIFHKQQVIQLQLEAVLLANRGSIDL